MHHPHLQSAGWCAVLTLFTSCRYYMPANILICNCNRQLFWPKFQIIAFEDSYGTSVAIINIQKLSVIDNVLEGQPMLASQ